MTAWSRVVAYVLVVGAVLVLVAILSLASSDSASADHAEEDTPTCSTFFPSVDEIDNHGEHVLDAYVGDPGGGVLLAGGPGAGGHLPAGFAPGASFCLDESQSADALFGP